ncbi:hypothetical protein QAD02_023614 [Eretmocerus hayati]|uniref:Uncharacterized protein n=1 Tax=Eretmocerus hayati TaxID=131215 RepID=A0ACC2PW60_9HYME|nr:hypothetical protein QAD02_023614 [Eretmocerus hayati]
MSSIKSISVIALAVLALFAKGTLSVKCYQCSSNTDAKGVDSCGAYSEFDKTQHVPVDCMSDESQMPGTFCVKITQQGPRGFIWDGRWRQVIRRCGSVASTGVIGVCNWGVYENGVYWQECSCNEESCNSAPKTSTVDSSVTLLATLIFGLCREFI